MKTILCAFVTALALAVVNSRLNMEAVRSCPKGLNYTDTDYRRMIVNGSTTREEKCFFGCIFNASGLIEDGKPTAKNAEEVANDLGTNPDMVKGIKDAIEKCSEEVKPAELCEMAEEMRACLYENGKQYMNL